MRQDEQVHKSARSAFMLRCCACCACCCFTCCSCCSWSHAWSHCSCCCRRFHSRVSVAILYLEVYSLHTPSVTVNCVGCYRIVTVILHQINFENHSTNNLPNHCFRRFPRSISAGSIVAVVSQMKDATRNLASSTKTRKSFATNFGNKLDPLDS